MRLAIILVIATALVAFAAVEQVTIDKTFKKMGRETDALIQMINAVPEDDEAYKSPVLVKEKIDYLHHYWIKTEKRLCVFMRHMELSYISDALIYARNFVHFDNKEESCAGLERLRYLVDAYSHVFGINALNMF